MQPISYILFDSRLNTSHSDRIFFFLLALVTQKFQDFFQYCYVTKPTINEND